MPLLFILRLLFAVLSLAILGASGYLLWDWWRGELVQGDDGLLHRVREDWRLWLAMVPLAWSFLGRFIVPLIIARADTDASKPVRGAGATLVGASGATLYVESHGPEDAPPLILTHGWGLDSTIWFYAVRELSKRFRVIVWDLPGLGRSRTAKDGAISLTDFAADLGTVIGLAGGRPVLLVGHSIGGMTIQTLARDAPGLFGREVAGVVLVNTTHTNPLKTMVLSGLAQALRWPVLEPLLRVTIWLQPLAWLVAWQSYLSGSAHLANRLGFGPCVTRSQLEHVTLLSTRNPPGASAKGNLAMFRWDATAALAAITAPTLVLGGDQDIVTKLEASRTIAARVPRGRLEIVEKANHMGFLDRSEIYLSAIAEFAAQIQSSHGAPFSQTAPSSDDFGRPTRLH